MVLSIVIVNYNVKYFLEQCLHAVNKATMNIAAEVFVVDNASVDGSCAMIKEKFQGVKLIENKVNVGFSRANNQAIKQSKGKYVLLLNPDTVVGENSFEKCIRFMEGHPDCGGLGVKMIDGKGNFLPESKRALPTPGVAFHKIFGLSSLFPKSKIFARYHLGYLDENKVNEVEILPGAFMMIRKEALDKTGLLDETFFMYGEDIDLSYRLTRAGYKNYYFPETTIIHYKGESTKKGSINYVLVFYNAMIIFAKKHFTGRNANFYAFMINLAIYFRAFIAIVHRTFNKIFLPFLDGVLFYVGNFLLANYYGLVKFSMPNRYPGEYFLYVLPFYVLIWITFIFFTGGYDKPVKIWPVMKGILSGTFLLLVIYALLPESLRYSRALLLLGTTWTLLSAVLARALLHFMGFKNYMLASYTRLRIAIVGSDEEASRVKKVLDSTGLKQEVAGLVSILPGATDGNYLGNINQIEEITRINKIDELIFCARDIASNDIMGHMLSLTNLNIDYKIAPPESLSIIGSNSINTAGELYTININSIGKNSNKRNKRLFDIFASGLLCCISPVLIFIVSNPLRMYKNIFQVLSGLKTWVGYHKPGEMANLDLPEIKKGVFSILEGAEDTNIGKEYMEKMNIMYAKDYRVSNDAILVARNIGRIGKK
jgi:GT2 family glycosyltransferase